MNQVRLNLGQLTPDAKSALALKVGDACSGSAEFAVLATAVTALQNARAPLETALTNLAATETQVKEFAALRDNALVDLDAALLAMASGVDLVAKGDKAVILDSGFDATADRQAPAPLGQVQNFSMSTSDQAGEADWHCSPLARSGGFQAQWTLTPGVAASWQPLAVEFPTRSKGTFTGLPSGQVATARLRGIGGTTGHGDWSALASCLVA